MVPITITSIAYKPTYYQTQLFMAFSLINQSKIMIMSAQRHSLNLIYYVLCITIYGHCNRKGFHLMFLDCKLRHCIDRNYKFQKSQSAWTGLTSCILKHFRSQCILKLSYNQLTGHPLKKDLLGEPRSQQNDSMIKSL